MIEYFLTGTVIVIIVGNAVIAVVVAMNWPSTKLANSNQGSFVQLIEPVLGDINSLKIPELDPTDPHFDNEMVDGITIDEFNTIVENDAE